MRLRGRSKSGGLLLSSARASWIPLLSPQLLIAALVLAAIYALIALGLNLIYGTMRLLNVAHGEIMMLAGYVSYWAFVRLGIGPLVSMIAAMLTAAIPGRRAI